MSIVVGLVPTDDQYFFLYCMSDVYIVLELMKGNFYSFFFSTPAIPLCIGRLWQCDRRQSILVGFRLVWLTVMASCLDNYWSQYFLHTTVPCELCFIAIGGVVVGYFHFTEELPACTSRALPPSSGPPRL